jgi:hypothetical protein
MNWEDSGRFGRWIAVRGERRSRVGLRRASLAAVVALAASLLALSSSGSIGAAAQGGCQTPFLVYTDPANPGVKSESGDVAFTQDSRLLGDFGGNGRFAGYAIDGTMDIIANTATGMARVQGEFVATSPDGDSSITVWYTGQVDFGAGMATGNFVAGNGSGDDTGYRSAGTIEGSVIAPATLDGVDIGLC